MCASTFAVVSQFRTVTFDEGKSPFCQKARDWIAWIDDLTVVSTFSSKGDKFVSASSWLTPLILSVFIDWMKYIESSSRIVFQMGLQ